MTRATLPGRSHLILVHTHRATEVEDCELANDIAPDAERFLSPVDEAPSFAFRYFVAPCALGAAAAIACIVCWVPW